MLREYDADNVPAEVLPSHERVLLVTTPVCWLELRLTNSEGWAQTAASSGSRSKGFGVHPRCRENQIRGRPTKASSRHTRSKERVVSPAATTTQNQGDGCVACRERSRRQGAGGQSRDRAPRIEKATFKARVRCTQREEQEAKPRPRSNPR